MKIWITRTEPGATVLAEAMLAAGYEVVKAPVLAVKPLSFARPAGSFELGVFLSVHAVRIAAAELAHQAEALFAVGQQTQAALKELGFDASAPSLATSEGLLQEIPDPAGKRVVIVTGAGGRDALHTRLTERGAEVTRLAVYVRYPLIPAITTEGVDAIVASSGAGFTQAARLWLASGGSPDIPALVPSARVAALGSGLGLSSVHDCGGANPCAVRRTLERLPASAILCATRSDVAVRSGSPNRPPGR